MGENRTLGDYIKSGRHEFVAFVREQRSLRELSGFTTRGNHLGKILFGLLVCDRKPEDERDPNDDRAKFFYKGSSRFEEDSDIMFHDFSYDAAQVVSQVPLSLEVSFFYNGWPFKRESEEFRKARELLQRYGLY